MEDNRKVMEWISVNRRLPVHGQRVLCVDIEGHWWESVFRRNQESATSGFVNIQYGDICNVYHIPFVTHWMPVIVPSRAERNIVLLAQQEIKED
jgi:hypothetical protein